MNIAMKDVETVTPGAAKKRHKEAFIRGNNGMKDTAMGVSEAPLFYVHR